MVEQRCADSLKLFWFLQISVGCSCVLLGDENHCAAKHMAVSVLGLAVGSVQEVFRFQQPAVMKFLLPSIKKPQRELWLKKTPRAGFEPATNRLTVDRSTAELPRNETRRTYLSDLPDCKRWRSSRPVDHGPIRPWSICAAPSASLSSSSRWVIQRAVIGLVG